MKTLSNANAKNTSISSNIMAVKRLSLHNLYNEYIHSVHMLFFSTCRSRAYFNCHYSLYYSVTNSDGSAAMLYHMTLPQSASYRLEVDSAAYFAASGQEACCQKIQVNV